MQGNDFEYNETERVMNELVGGLDPEERADMEERRREQTRSRQETAVKKAKALLRKIDRPVRRADMLSAMAKAIRERTEDFEKLEDEKNAVLMLGTIFCRNILIDGPLHEERGGDKKYGRAIY